MNNKVVISLAILFGLNVSSVLAEGIMIPGGWETTMSMIAENPSTGEKKNIGESKASTCLSKEFLASDPYLTATLDQGKLKGRGVDCSVENYEREGAMAHWMMACTTNDGKSFTMKFNVKLSAKQVVATVNQVVTQGSQSAYINSSVKHTYIGECTDDMPRL